MASQPEAVLERQLIEKLSNRDYEYVPHIKDYESLMQNFRKIVNEHNAESLSLVPLTDTEFNRLLAQIEDRSIIDSAKLLRNKIPLERDDGEKVHIELLQKEKWCQNKYQIISQLKMEGQRKQRYDVTILINGLPLIHIELKKRGREVVRAFEQIENYKKMSMHGLFGFTQIFVISSGIVTKYFANNQKLNYNFSFYWTDDKNNKISSLMDFADTFLEKCHISEMIVRYMVVQEKAKELKVLRPYQVYAVKSIIKRAKETANNGYIWHTTGSGKTLTSFKVAQILKFDPEINAKKVIFLVDRKDLDSQTLDEFKVFGGDDFLDQTNSTQKLTEQLESTTTDNKMIITTIQKMDKFLNSQKYKKIIDKIQNDKVIFIIDECHRSQYGKMHANVKRNFLNAQYFGFTGTPLKKEEQTTDQKLTEQNFDKCLHSYLIKDAIADKNVLGFNVDYYSIKSITETGDEEKDTKKYAASNRIEQIANTILEKHKRLTHNKNYCAILTVQDINTLIKYYNKIEELNKDESFKFSAIYSLNKASDQKPERVAHHEKNFKKIIDNYNEMYQKEYSLDSTDLFFKDINSKLKTGLIDLVIVVDMLLTGFDSKKLNTLYVDKNLKYHNLLQAYSRTNRVEEKLKEHGNIICFRPLKDNTDEAIKLYSNSDQTDDVIIKQYGDQKKELVDLVSKVNNFGTTDEIQAIQSETKKLEFVDSMKSLVKKVNTLQTFTEFEFNDVKLNIDEVMELDEFNEEYKDLSIKEKVEKAIEWKYDELKSVYAEIAYSVQKAKVNLDEDDETELDQFEFELELIRTDSINVDYIMALLNEAINEEDVRINNDKRLKKLEEIRKYTERLDGENKEVVSSFIDKHCKPLIEKASLEEIDVFEEFEKFKNNEIANALNSISQQNNIEIKFLQQLIDEYNFAGKFDEKIITDGLSGKGLGLLKLRNTKKTIKEQLTIVIEKYCNI